ncbi:MAG: zf-HC2 domain-containing protein, partial [Gammaproteobacteria bacterium]|nr:zf-HC2 domain-containing protein [Gammaproteobacteria bacterium]
MHCEHVQSLLFEYADLQLAQNTREELSEHLDTCPQCSEDYASILEMESRAQVWHDLPAPSWQVPKIASHLNFSLFTQWFPSLASASALVLVGILYFAEPGAEPRLALPPVSAPPYTQAVNLQDIDQEILMQTVLDSNRAQRRQDLEAIARLLKGEMDRRSLETEESLRYVIAHQIQSQQELDDLYQRV